jgi:hypothetical protein
MEQKEAESAGTHVDEVAARARQRGLIVTAILGEVEMDTSDEVPRRVASMKQLGDAAVFGFHRLGERVVEYAPLSHEQRRIDVLTSDHRRRARRERCEHLLVGWRDRDRGVLAPCAHRGNVSTRDIAPVPNELGSGLVISAIPSCSSPAPTPCANASRIRARKVSEALARVPATTIDEFKNVYSLDFLALSNDHSEADLHGALLRKLGRFITELGRDFCFVGFEYPVQVGNQDFAIDLVFFHRALVRQQGR